MERGEGKLGLDDDAMKTPRQELYEIDYQNHNDDQLLQKNRLYAFISQINKAVLHISEEQLLLQKACNIAVETGKFQKAWITIKYPTTGQTSTFNQSEIGSESSNEVLIENVDAQVHVSDNGTQFVFNGSESDLKSYQEIDLDSGSLIVLPLRKSGIVVGTFDLYSTDKNSFSDQEISLLEEVATDLSYGLDVIKVREQSRKEIEALRKSEANLQAVFNNTSEGFILTDLDGLILEFNATAKNIIYDNSKETLARQKELIQYLPDFNRELYLSKLNKVAADETVSYEYAFGSTWFKFKITPVYNVDIITGFCVSFKEITEQKLAKKRLKDSESFNNDVLSSLTSHIAVVNADGIIVAVNKAWDDFLKLNSTTNLPNSSIGSNYFDVCRNAILRGDDDAKQTLEGILSVLNKEKDSFQLEYPCHSPDEQRWFNLNVSLLGDEGSKVVVSHQNITARKLAENKLSDTSLELQKTLSELNQIVDSSLDIICTINDNGEFVNVSKASQEVLGYSPEELVGTKFMNLVFHEDVEITTDAADKIYRQIKIPSFENRYVHKTGKIVHLLWSVNWDPKLQLTFCVAKDISEKKRLKKAVKIERDRFYDMFLKAPSAIGMLKGPNHIFEFANPLYLKLTGKENLLGKTVAEVFPEVIDQGFGSLLDHVYQTGQSYTDQEVLIKITEDGTGNFTDYYIDFVFQAYRNSDGQIEGIFFFMNDITEQVEARKRIEESEKKYRRIVETAQEGIWLIDENGRTTFVNKKMCEILEYSEEEMLGKAHSHFMNENDKHLALSSLERRKTGDSENLEFTFLTKSGRNVLTKISATPIFDDVEGFKGSLGMVYDITEHKHLENLLEKSNRLARIGSWEIDVVKGTVFWSDITKEIREADPDFIPDLTTGISLFNEGHDREIISERVRQCIENGTPWDEELQFLTFKGNLKWVRTIGEAVFSNGKCTKVYGTFQDITERKNAIEKILQSEAKLNVAQLIAQVGSWEVEMATNEHTWSEEFYRILEIDENVTPSAKAFLRFVHPDDLETAQDAMKKAFEIHADSSFDFRFIRKNGEIGYGTSEWRFAFNKDGSPYFIYGILRDLTKEKKAEIERLKMISDIIQRNKDLEQFSYIISHNLRSPVANIIGLTEELKDETHTAETKLILGDALSSDVQRLEDVIVDLNTILQTKREVTERKEHVNLTRLVETIKNGMMDLIQKGNVHITTDFREIEDINTIKTYIQSIFYNLISNSIKYRRPNVDAEIDIKSHISNGKILIIFKDNGIGIDLAKIGDQIFGLYKRFHSGTEGKGMGLYMVKTQVEALGGIIKAKSEPNIGAEFIIEFDYSE